MPSDKYLSHKAKRHYIERCDELEADNKRLREEIEQCRADNARLRERLADYENAAKMAADQACTSDEKHCACVPFLRADNARLRAALGDVLHAVIHEVDMYDPGLQLVGDIDRVRADLDGEKEDRDDSR